MPKNPELGRHFRKGESYGFARRPRQKQKHNDHRSSGGNRCCDHPPLYNRSVARNLRRHIHPSPNRGRPQLAASRFVALSHHKNTNSSTSAAAASAIPTSNWASVSMRLQPHGIYRSYARGVAVVSEAGEVVLQVLGAGAPRGEPVEERGRDVASILAPVVVTVATCR
jgi:hypothetical protein